MKRFLIFLFVCKLALLPTLAFSQKKQGQARLDSLLAQVPGMALAQPAAALQKGIRACREARFPEGMPDFADSLSKVLARQGHCPEALTAYHESVRLRDSLSGTTSSNEAVEGLETKRAMRLKDKDILIARLKQRTDWVMFIGGAAVLFLLLGILFRGYNKQRYTNWLLSKEKKRSEDLLLNILPAEVAEELKDGGVSAARQYEEVTVLFTDFVNFTGTAQNLSPQALVQELHECFSAFDAICERNGLEKIKTIGDAYMAVCGLPVADERHAQRTVQAALEIRDFIAHRTGLPPAPSRPTPTLPEGEGGKTDIKRNIETDNERTVPFSAVTLPLRGRAGDRADGQATFQIRIGIHSGPVVAGIVGVKKFAYDIWGDTVNTANRMEQSGEAGKVNISQSTYELVKADFHCTPRGKIAAKGKGEVEMYFVEIPANQEVF